MLVATGATRLGSDASGECTARRIGELIRATKSPEEGMMIVRKTAADTGRRLAKIALVGTAMTIPMVSVPAMAAPAPAPAVVRTDNPHCAGYDPWGIDRWQSDRWGKDKCHGQNEGWGSNNFFPQGWGSNNFFPKGWFGSS
ncbi:hypothetical protein [Nocardia sp. NPDC057440]|uniref:hypothetical protein n=1 Tax=Nocardia sp. NPDC057440 TaxID=3346134 RepID=UPI00366F3673